MRVPGNLSAQYRVIMEERIDIHALFHDYSSSLKEKYLRKYVAPVLNYLPTGARYFITDIAKKLRNPSRGLRLHYPLDFPENRLIAARVGRLRSRPWWGKKAVICLSHDVDNDEGYGFLRTMASMDLEAGVPSTFNLLTHDNYAIEERDLGYLSEHGFEIGLHGYRHDQGFSFRSVPYMKRKMAKAIERLREHEVVGTRTPALSRSANFFRAAAETGLKYDSSLQIGSAIYTSVRIPYPYYYEQSGMWEIPLMIQDDNYLRDAAVPESAVMGSLRRFVEDTVALQGVMVLNVHPHLMAGRPSFYSNILKTVTGYASAAAFKTTGDVYRLAARNAVDIS